MMDPPGNERDKKQITQGGNALGVAPWCGFTAVDFMLLTPTTAREYISVVVSYQVCCNLL